MQNFLFISIKVVDSWDDKEMTNFSNVRINLKCENTIKRFPA